MDMKLSGSSSAPPGETVEALGGTTTTRVAPTPRQTTKRGRVQLREVLLRTELTISTVLLHFVPQNALNHTSQHSTAHCRSTRGPQPHGVASHRSTCMEALAETQIEG